MGDVIDIGFKRLEMENKKVKGTIEGFYHETKRIVVYSPENVYYIPFNFKLLQDMVDIHASKGSFVILTNYMGEWRVDNEFYTVARNFVKEMGDDNRP